MKAPSSFPADLARAAVARPGVGGTFGGLWAPAHPARVDSASQRRTIKGSGHRHAVVTALRDPAAEIVLARSAAHAAPAGLVAGRGPVAPAERRA